MDNLQDSLKPEDQDGSPRTLADAIKAIEVAIALGGRVEAPAGSIFYNILIYDNGSETYSNLGSHSTLAKAQKMVAKWYTEEGASTDPADQNMLPWVKQHQSQDDWVEQTSYEDVLFHLRNDGIMPRIEEKRIN